MFTNAEVVALMTKIHRNDSSRYNALRKLANNPRFAAERPQTHAFIKNLYTFYCEHGFLTDRQKEYFSKEVYKQAQFILSLSPNASQYGIRNVDATEMSTVEEREAIMNEDVPLDEAQAM